MKVVFNSSLPRSGSTLVQNILAQNRRFYCTPTSGVVELLLRARRGFSESVEFRVVEQAAMKSGWLGFCRAALEGFYSSITNADVVCDKSRGWIGYLDFLKAFYPNPKVFVCVRDIRSIMVSMEKLHQKNAHINDPADNQMNFTTIDKRVTHWMSNPPVGIALQRLNDALNKGQSKDLHFVVYEKLIENPQDELDKLYDYLEEDRFTHNFSSIEQRTHENDSWHGIYGEHTIRPVIESNTPDWDNVLGRELSHQLVARNWWFYSVFYPGAIDRLSVLKRAM